MLTFSGEVCTLPVEQRFVQMASFSGLPRDGLSIPGSQGKAFTGASAKSERGLGSPSQLQRPGSPPSSFPASGHGCPQTSQELYVGHVLHVLQLYICTFV